MAKKSVHDFIELLSLGSPTPSAEHVMEALEPGSVAEEKGWSGARLLEAFALFRNPKSIVDDLLTATMKKSRSYASELGRLTLAELETQAKTSQKTRKVLKLVKESRRLQEKYGAKP